MTNISEENIWRKMLDGKHLTDNTWRTTLDGKQLTETLDGNTWLKIFDGQHLTENTCDGEQLMESTWWKTLDAKHLTQNTWRKHLTENTWQTRGPIKTNGSASLASLRLARSTPVCIVKISFPFMFALVPVYRGGGTSLGARLHWAIVELWRSCSCVCVCV